MSGLKNLRGNLGVMAILLATLFTGASALAYEIWVVNRLSSTISVVSTERDRVVRTIRKVGDKPDILAFSPDGGKAFVTLRGRATTGDPKLLSGSEPGLSVIDVRTGTVIAKVKLGGDPHGVGVRP